ncbi:MAG: DUF6745 domain-containing protein, partial [Cyanobacteria bacterium J06639_1]
TETTVFENLPASEETTSDAISRFREVSSRFVQLPAFSLMLNTFIPSAWLEVVSHVEFGNSVLGCQFSDRRLFALKSLTRHCGWIFPFEKAALVCDRPTNLVLDRDGLPSGKEGSGTSFADGFSIGCRTQASESASSSDTND